MTEIKINKAPFSRGLYACGHSGHSYCGNDIVCASVSSLICTLSLFLEKEGEKNGIRCIRNELSKGKADIFFKSKDALILTVFDAVCDGLFEIEKQYPFNLKIITEE